MTKIRAALTPLVRYYRGQLGRPVKILNVGDLGVAVGGADGAGLSGERPATVLCRPRGRRRDVPDRARRDDLRGAGNLFTVFGEPDIDISETSDGFVVTVKGVDVYDPTTGEVRSSRGTSDVALWMIDTDYNEESFFVRHCYFTGDNDPYKRLKTALKADIDADAWDSLYKTFSRPFPRPSTGKIAVKVINDYGDEVMKVFEVT